MKEIKKDNEFSVVRFDPGEDVISGLLSYCADHSIEGAVFSGIGAAESATLACYSQKERAYKKKEFCEPLEIAHLAGSVAQGADGLMVHAHGVLGRTSFEALAGHIFELVVSFTCEVTLRACTPLRRDFDADTGLNLLK